MDGALGGGGGSGGENVGVLNSTVNSELMLIT